MLIQNNEFLGQVTSNYQDNPAVAEAIATNGQFKINKPTQAQPYVIETRNASSLLVSSQNFVSSA
jgi:beta-galactosidase/beta-glucuronidase